METERFYSIVRNTKLGICPERHAADPDIYHRAVAGGALRAQGLSDKKLVEQVADVKLTERMSDPTFTHISAGVRGPKSRMALLGLADESQSSICRLRGFPPRPHLITQRSRPSSKEQSTLSQRQSPNCRTLQQHAKASCLTERLSLFHQTCTIP